MNSESGGGGADKNRKILRFFYAEWIIEITLKYFLRGALKQFPSKLQGSEMKG